MRQAGPKFGFARLGWEGPGPIPLPGIPGMGLISTMLKDVDAADRAFLLRALSITIPSAVIISLAVALYLRETRHVGGLMVLATVVAGLAVGIGAGLGSWYLAGRAGAGAAHVLLAGGNLPPAPSYSYQESLVARGRYQDAVDSFAAHLLDHPRDQDARLAMADVLATHLRDLPRAVAVYQQVRAEAGNPAQEYRAHQSLIDLHRAAGDRGRLMAELSRFADRYRDTTAGRAARAALAEMKSER